MDSAQYRLYDPAKNTVFQSRDVKFDEHLMYRTVVAGGEHAIANSDDYPDNDDELVNDASPPVAPVLIAAAPAPIAANPAAPDAPPPPPPVRRAGPGRPPGRGRSTSAAPLLLPPGSAHRAGRSAGPPQDTVVPAALLRARNLGGLMDFNVAGIRDEAPAAIQVAPDNDRDAAAQVANDHDEQVNELADELLALTASTDAPIVTDPLSVEAAMQTPQAAQWKAAMQAEIDALHAAGTYELAPLPSGHRAIGCKWVLKAKRNAQGAIVKYKARLVAKGFAQRYGIDYEETYAPVCRIGSIRVLIALAAHFDWEIHHMDVTSAFLNGDLEEVVYMQQPPSFEASGAQAGFVCKLKKSLYGLKQAGRTWNHKIDGLLRQSGFTALDADNCVYKREDRFSVIVISLYVDDLLLFSNDLPALADFKKQLARHFSMTDLGEAKFILGIEIIRDRTQRTYRTLAECIRARCLASTYGMATCNSAATPVRPDVRLTVPVEGYVAELSDTRRYQAMVGALMWLAICTRPDMSYAVGQLSRYASNPDKPHFDAVTQCLRYLRSTVDYRLTYVGKGRMEDVPPLIGFSDADWAGELDTRRSTTGYLFQLSGGAVSWQSKRQRTTAQSTVEAEYMAAVAATKESIWLRLLLTGIGCAPAGPIVLHVDNEGAICCQTLDVSARRSLDSRVRARRTAQQHRYVQ